ncbi:hypothetical protein YC2023_007808 [Brassica napus]
METCMMLTQEVSVRSKQTNDAKLKPMCSFPFYQNYRIDLHCQHLCQNLAAYTQNYNRPPKELDGDDPRGGR